MEDSLWNVPDPEDLRTPLSMLKSQAEYLTRLSRGLVCGEVETSGGSDRFSIDLNIVVPNLNDYTYMIIKYTQPMPNIYPGYFYSSLDDQGWTVSGEDGFQKVLKSTLSSTATRGLLTSLMAQAKGI